MAATDDRDRDDSPEAPEEQTGDDIQVDSKETSADETAPGDVESESAEKLDLEVSVNSRGACERHITVTVPRPDIERYFDHEFSELMDSAQVPGFRKGHAPRKLVESRFRKDIADKVKGLLLSDSVAQVNDDEDLSPISEPDIKWEAIELPNEGPMTFEFDLEVRPEFDLPQWKGLSIKKPVRDFTDEDVDAELSRVLADRYGSLVPHDGPASAGDYITTNLTFKYDDKELAAAEEEVIRIRPVLSFRDGKIEKFDKLMRGGKAGETREGKAILGDDAPNVILRGKKVAAIFEVLEVKKLELPELTPEFLEEIGDFKDEGELRDLIKDNLERQLDYEQHQRAREQITAALTVAADWELPRELLERQSRRELQRAVMELQRSGFSEEEIRSHTNELQQNSQASTAQALKEHFILERIAEDEDTEVDESDYQAEISLIASQSGESVRRVRARLEKGGMMDALHNQVIERKVIDLILSEAQFKEVPYEPEATDAEAIDRSAGGHDKSDIPEAEPEHPEGEQGSESES